MSVLDRLVADDRKRYNRLQEERMKVNHSLLEFLPELQESDDGMGMADVHASLFDVTDVDTSLTNQPQQGVGYAL
jgi:hypothetical protein